MTIKPRTLSPSELQIAIVRDPLTIRAEAQMIDAVAEMSNARITCLSIVSFPVMKEELHVNARSSCIFVVNDRNQPVGILTDRDVVRLTSHTVNFQDCPVKEVMTTPLVTLPDSRLTDLFLAVTLMQSYQIRHLPLVDAQGALTGVVTHETLRHASSPTDLLRLRRVHEVMTTEVITASSDDSITHISGLMARDRVSCVVIVETRDGSDAAIGSVSPSRPIIQPIGLLTEQDIVQFHALALDPQTHTARQVMRVSNVSVKPNDPLAVVRERMEHHRLTCLTVTGSQGELIGLITQSDLLALINPAEIHRINELLEQRVYQLEADQMSLLQVRASELEQQLQDRIQALQAKADREALLIELSKQIRASLNVRSVLETAVQEVKTLLHCDRVTICRLTTQDGTESLELIDGPEQAVYISLPDAGLDSAWLQHYATGEQYIGLRLVEGHDCPPKIDPVEEGSGTKVVMPILVDETLWGLLVASERSQSRTWDMGELEFLDRLVVQIAIAIQQATAYEQLQMELNERRQAEIWWHESERRYHALAESVPVGIFRVSIQGHIQYINQRCLDLLDLERSQIQHNTWLHRIHPADRQRIEEAHNRIQRNGTPFQEEYRLQYEDGTIRWVSGQVVPSFDEMGYLQSYTGSIVDIHERKQAELSLQVVNQALEDRVLERTRELSALTTLQSAIFNGTNYAIVATDPDGIILQMNTAAEQLLGYRASEVVEQESLTLFLDREDLTIHAAALSIELGTTIEPGFEVLAIQAQCDDANEYECTYLSKAGDRIPVSVSMTALFQEDDELLGFVAIARNLSEHQKAEAELRRLSERLSLAVTAGQIGIWDWDIRNDRLEWNDRMYELYDVTRETVQNNTYETWAQRLHPEDFDRCTQMINAAVAGDCEFEAEFRLILPDGSTRYIQAFSKATRNLSGRAIRMIGLNMDITDRRNSEQQLHAQAQRERLLRKITERIRRSLDLQQIFDVATDEVRHYLNVDRVGIFRINEAGQSSDGQFVAESITKASPSLLSIAIDDPCFNTQKCTMYENGAIQAITDIHTASLDPCYHQMLDQLQIRANLVIPLLLHTGCVWGLLCIHKCHHPRAWSASDIDFAEQIGSQLSIAVRQANLFQQLQGQLAEQKIKEEALQQQLTAIEASVDGIAILQNNLFIYINQAHVRLFGYRSADEMLGQSWEILYSEEEKTRFEREVFPILGAQGQWKGEALALHLDGHHFYEELSLTLSGNGFLICVCRDISDRKHNEQALQQANLELARATRHKDEFLANMSHELRTPLNAILGMTEGLQEGMLGDLTDEQMKALQVVERGGRHLLDLINDILDLAKIEAGHVDLHYTTASLASLCQASTSFVRQQAMKKSIALNVQTPAQDLNVQFDERRIRQVLINLLNNAVKFTPEGGTITLEVTVVDRKEAEAIILTHPRPSQNTDHGSRRDSPLVPLPAQNPAQNPAQKPTPSLSDHPQWLRFRVTDTGIGIAPENIDRLFRPFSQIDSALNRHYSGTGLGLALIKHIAELHGGTVGVQSQEGVGSEFWMLIPLSIAANPETISIPDDAPPRRVSTLSADQPAPLILLAEDNLANILTMTNYLKAKGFRIIIAKDGQEAIAVTQSQMVDLILMDIQLPTIDGLEAMQRIRQNPNYATVPIVAVTALTMGGDRERCLNAGADDYLSKPVQLKQLVHTIQDLLGRVEVKA